MYFLAAIDQKVLEWIQHGGYAMLFGLLFSCGLGMPLPEDIPLLAAGGMIAAGKFNFVVAAICAWCGIIGGDCVLYCVGRKFGDDVPKIPVIGRHVTLERMRHVHGLFEKYGIWVVAVGRMFAGIRGAMVVVAGASRFTFWKFFLADGIAAIVSGGLFLYLGYVFGKNMDQLIEHVKAGKTYVLIGVVVLAVIGGIYLWWRRKHPRSHGHSPRLAEPDPVVPPVEEAPTIVNQPAE